MGPEAGPIDPQGSSAFRGFWPHFPPFYPNQAEEREMRKRSVLILLILVQGFSGLLFGQEKYNLEIGPYAGVGVWQDRNFQLGPPQASPSVKFGFHLAEKPVYGVRFNLLSRGHWGGEVAYAYENNTVTLSLPPQGAPPPFVRVL